MLLFILIITCTSCSDKFKDDSLLLTNLLITGKIFELFPPTIAISGSPFVFDTDVSITPIIPDTEGRITFCTVSPPLPAGLTVNQSTCLISGAATVSQSATVHTVTAGNSAGGSSVVITITVNLSPAPTLSYAGSTFLFTRNTAITMIDATVSGIILSCTSSPPLPAGLTIDNTTCDITGTPTDYQSFITYTITASNSTGNATALMDIEIDNEWIQDAYIKATNAEGGDNFGNAVAIDGDYAVIGAYHETSGDSGIINDDDASITDSSSASTAGAVYVLKRDLASGNWIQDAYLKPSNTKSNDEFGNDVAISGDSIIVAAWNEDSNATSITNDDGSHSGTYGSTSDNPGTAFIFKRDAATGDWIQDAHLKASNSQTGDNFGSSVSIYGEYAAVGASNEDSNATSITNSDGSVSGTDAGPSDNYGAVYIFRRNSSGDWIQDAYLKVPESDTDDDFGEAVTLHGAFLAASSRKEDSNQTGITNTDDTADTDNSSDAGGAVYLFKLDTGTGLWSQDAYLKASNSGSGDEFGKSIDLYDNQLIVGSWKEDSHDTAVSNIDGTHSALTDATSSEDYGAAYIFKRDAVSGNWIQDAYLKPSDGVSLDRFGESVSVNQNFAVVGAPEEASTAAGITNTDATGDANTSDAGTGAVYIFKKDPITGNWIQDAYVKASNPGKTDNFGCDVSVSSEDRIVIGALNESFEVSSTPPTINNTDNSDTLLLKSATNSGAAYIFKRK
ncbi:MAG: putative Ig domain-containing protein [Spirochaetia bacterium]|nr:putative Ig domain-containing protein [Spirochaetia bacterium]